MSLVSEVLTRFLTGKPPADIEKLAEIYAAERRQQNSAMARELSGVPAGRLPAKGTEARRRYDAARRNVERYRAPEGRQRRKPSPKTFERLRGGARRILTARNVERARKDGLMMRVRMWYLVSRVYRVATMPADAGGQRQYVGIEPGMLRETLGLWETGDDEAAGEALLWAFIESYWKSGGPMPEQLGEVESVQLRWPGQLRSGEKVWTGP